MGPNLEDPRFNIHCCKNFSVYTYMVSEPVLAGNVEVCTVFHYTSMPSHYCPTGEANRQPCTSHLVHGCYVLLRC
jgi:hypothetical protein